MYPTIELEMEMNGVLDVGGNEMVGESDEDNYIQLASEVVDGQTYVLRAPKARWDFLLKLAEEEEYE